MEIVFQVIQFFSFAINIALGVLVFFGRPKARVRRYFVLFVFSIAFWILTLYFFYQLTDPTVVYELGKLNFVFAELIFYFLALFVEVFPEENHAVPQRRFWLISLWTAALVVLTQFTPLVDGAEIIKGLERVTVFGPLYGLFIVHCVFFAVYSILRLVWKYRRLSAGDMRRLQISYFAIGWVFTVVLAIATQIFIPFFTGNYDLQNVGPAWTVFMVGFTAVAIIRHRLLSLKIVAAELFAMAVVLIYVVEVGSSRTSAELALRISGLVVTVFFALQLIRSVRDEVRRREEIQKLADDLSIANEKLEELSEMKSNFVSIASHQLRAPIGGVRGYLSMLREGDFGKLPNKVHDLLDLNLDSLNHTLHVIETFLNVTRLEAGKIDLQKVPVDVCAMVRDIYKELKLTADRKRIRLVVSCPVKRVPLKADKEKLRNVLFNLVENALKYTERGTIKTTVVPGRTVEVRVTDTGIGIEKEEVPKLFAKFVRAGGGLKISHGSGLGLYIAKTLIEAHGGGVFVESPGPGKGSTFGFRIPAGRV